jgi:hypothetical protein
VMNDLGNPSAGLAASVARICADSSHDPLH